jgi:AcrR family transcriptional regulator
MTKTEIVQAAFRVWGEKFYRKTSLSQIAESLAVTKPALYRHFKNKEALSDAMYGAFFDRFATFLDPYYKTAINPLLKPTESLHLLARAFVEYYLRNPDDFIFSLTNVYGNDEVYKKNLFEQMRRRRIDLHHFMLIEGFTGNAFNSQAESAASDDCASYPLRIQLVLASCICMVAHFHGQAVRESRRPSEQELIAFAELMKKQIQHGINFDAAKIAALDWEALEQKVEAQEVASFGEEPERLMKAVASAVAEAGPWETSMNMIAEKSGLSKSSLYSHFENKHDMLRRLFFSVAEKIISRAQACGALSDKPEEQLYLAVMGIVTYLKAKPDILIIMDWVRLSSTSKKHDATHEDFENKAPWDGGCRDDFADLEKIHTIFSHIKNNAGEALLDDRQTDCILFLVVNTMMRHPPEMSFSDMPNNSFRILYKFITRGIE